MSLLAAFVSHEWLTQLRAGRFRVLASIYLLLATSPAVALLLMSRRVPYAVGPATYSFLLDLLQPLPTALIAGVLSLDAITRERDEGSLAVAGVAPLAASTYVILRWLAVVTVVAPLTFVPRLVAYAAAAAAWIQPPAVAPFAFGWLLHALVPLLLASALAIALGTITGRTVVAMIAGALLFTVGFGLLNDLLVYVHRRYDGPGSLFAPSPEIVTRVSWWVQGWGAPPSPTDAGYDVRNALAAVAASAASAVIAAATLLGCSTLYLRRTRRDVRPWNIRANHPLRSMLHALNRLRDEYTPDGGIERQDRAVVAAALGLAVAAGAYLVQRDSHFIALAAERYAAETSDTIREMPASIVPLRASIDGHVDRDGRVTTRASIALRNDGATPRARLTFVLNARMRIVRVTADRGSAHASRLWERVAIDVQPPLASGETRSLAFELSGRPAEVRFALRRGGPFASRYRAYANATKSIELDDLSRSEELPSVDEAHVALRAHDLVPVPRYTPFTSSGRMIPTFVPESIAPAMPLQVSLRLPKRFVAADSCGTLSTSNAFRADCAAGLADYSVAGGPLATMDLGGLATLVHIPLHASLARLHAPSIAAATVAARQAWPGLGATAHVVFVEQPASSGLEFGHGQSPRMQSSGSMHLLPEQTFTRFRPIESSALAASIVANALRVRRPVPEAEENFFRRFYATIAELRINATGRSAVYPPRGPRPRPEPLLAAAEYRRGDDEMEKVLTDLEYRVGSDRLVAAIDEFTSRRATRGTARELLEVIGRHGATDLDRMYDDYFTGTAVPRLTFADVTFTRAGDAWQVRGLVRNLGTGESICPIVLRTAAGSLRSVVRVGSAAATPFAFTTAAEPRTLQLDPERMSYRDGGVGIVDSIDHRGAL